MPVVSRLNPVHVPMLRSVLLGLGVFALCMVGILSRPHFDLATFWPANAFMLGMIVRFPRLATTATWVSCAAGFVLADAVTGSALLNNIVLNGTNLASVATGHALLGHLSREDRRLQRPTSILYLLRAIFFASLVAGVSGVVVNPMLFGGPWTEGLFFWGASEMANYMAFLPVFLTAPPAAAFRRVAIRRQIAELSLKRIMPLLALVASAAAGVLVGGPGAVAFPVPALLWCALSYNLFTVACLAFVFSAWTVQAMHLGFITGVSTLDSRAMLTSTRFGITLIALGPLVVGSVMAARNELVERLRILAERDSLTGLRNRRAFFADSAAALTRATVEAPVAAAMMIDIDHFKAVNDTYGHEAGDRVLTNVARILQSSVRDSDIAGRIGGEEFAVVLPGCDLPEALAVAGRIRDGLRRTNVNSGGDRAIRVTVSIGIDFRSGESSIDRLLAQADKALYRAKEAGRDRSVFLPGEAETA